MAKMGRDPIYLKMNLSKLCNRRMSVRICYETSLSAVTANQKIIVKVLGLDEEKKKMSRIRKTSKKTLDEKIEKAEADVIVVKKRYE